MSGCHFRWFVSVVFMAMVVGCTTAVMQCSDALLKILNCETFLLSAVSQPSTACCSAVQSLGQTANASKDDRRALCQCFKQAARAFPINLANAQKLPTLCHITIGLTIDPNVDCSRKPVGTNVNGLKGLNQYEALESKVKRITKSAPSPGTAHKVPKALNLHKALETKAFRITKSAPSPGTGHKVPKTLNLHKSLETKAFRITKSAPSPGTGHKVPKTLNLHKSLETKAFRITKSAPSPGTGHKIPKALNLQKSLETKAFRITKSAPSPGTGHKVPNKAFRITKSAPSPGEGHKVPKAPPNSN